MSKKPPQDHDWHRPRSRLLRWFGRHRRNYPWRKTDNWFHLLMAEMMLRRTRADQVAPVYADFCNRYASPNDACRATARSFQRVLAPLGLEWRARQLRETVHYLRDHYALRAPEPTDDLEAIPGVGPYSNAMLRNRLFGERVAAIDSNVARFICRLTDREYHAESRRNREVTALANDFVNSPRAADLNLAILDLSALVCKPRRPDCPACPLTALCRTGQRTTGAGSAE